VRRGAMVVLFALCAAPAPAATVSGTLRVRGAVAPGAVVYLERVGDPAAGPVPHSHAVMDQRNLTFAPRVLPVVVGTTVDFTNSDDTQHNVFSPSRAAGKFDLGTYSRGETRSVTMREPGDVLVLCNIHMEMEAHILVLRDPYFALAGGDGRYRIPDVPAGRYEIRLWRGTWLPMDRTIDVPDAAGAVALDVEG